MLDRGHTKPTVEGGSSSCQRGAGETVSPAPSPLRDAGQVWDFRVCPGWTRDSRREGAAESERGRSKTGRRPKGIPAAQGPQCLSVILAQGELVGPRGGDPPSVELSE